MYARKVGFTILEAYVNYRPMRVFFSIGGLMCIAGLLFGIRVLSHFLATGQVSPYLPSALLSALLLIVGFQVLMLGLLAELIRRKRKVQEEILYLEKKRLAEK